jgi:hypothetical protein
MRDCEQLLVCRSVRKLQRPLDHLEALLLTQRVEQWVSLQPAASSTLRLRQPAREIAYFMLFVVIQTCGAPFTPAFPIAAFRSGDAAKALAFSTLLKSWMTVTSLALSAD